MYLVYVDFLVFLFQHFRWTCHLKHQVCQGSESNPQSVDDFAAGGASTTQAEQHWVCKEFGWQSVA
jgi:hypothetical protein